MRSDAVAAINLSKPLEKGVLPCCAAVFQTPYQDPIYLRWMLQKKKTELVSAKILWAWKV